MTDHDELLAAAKEVMGYFDSGDLTRKGYNTMEPDWRERKAKVVLALVRFDLAIRRAEGERREAQAEHANS